ncbi:MbcA/ParS/Xre antitoxin family protein [Variovorax sp. SG517]|uniref:antitoxin Xre/MbcA/ParS toxin-binding domain-containing protein n=1 Tax=Variovorax sp. SG517 TaxID=2587117 RepID=UPI00159DEB96
MQPIVIHSWLLTEPAPAPGQCSTGTADLDCTGANRVAQWLDQPLSALNGQRPGDLMDTAEGQAMVSRLLSRIQSGAYA